MFPIISIGPISLPAPGLILMAGIWVGLTVAERLAPRFKANPNQLYNLVFVMLITGVVGARLSYIFQHLDAFIQSLRSVVSLNPALLDPVGGVAVAFVSSVIYVYRKQIPVWPTLDALTPFFSIIWIAIGFSNLASGKAFGMETQVPWGIDLWGAQRHPTQIYQVMAGFIILGLVWPREKVTASASLFSGETFWLFSSLSATAWMVVEAFKGDSSLLPGGLRIAQILAWFALSISLWGLGWIRKKSTNSDVPV